MKVTVLPLDSRPCNHAWVKKYASLAGVDLAIVPVELSGNLFHGLTLTDPQSWLREQTLDSDCLILSADALTSGGLIQARQACFNLEDAMESINNLSLLKQTNPNLKIYVFDTIMRTSITAYDEETQKYWALVNKYSKALGLSILLPSEEHSQELVRIKAMIPEHILTTYHQARDKKRTLNHRLCDLVANKTIDYLTLLQEDSMPYGIQIAEGEELKKKIKNLGISSFVSLHNGTDEGTVVLLAKYLLEAFKITPKVHLMLPDKKLKRKTMPFEDRPLIDNYKHLSHVIGLKEGSLRNADYILPIYTEPSQEGLDLESYVEIDPKRDSIYHAFIKKTNQLIHQNRNVAFCDLLFPNGGSEVVLRDINYKNLLAYSAWNTASNALGSILALIAVHSVNKQADMSRFLKERIVDDCLYQSVVRPILNESCQKAGINIHGMTEDQAKELTIRVNQELNTQSKNVVNGNFIITFPWNRTFEIDIDME